MNNKNKNPETLDLVLKVKWYEMIESGFKREEYRKIGAFWAKRLCISPKTIKCRERAEKCVAGDFSVAHCWTLRDFRFVRFHRAYTSTTMTFKIDGIEINEGNPEWGAVPGEKYFVIKLGQRLNQNEPKEKI